MPSPEAAALARKTLEQAGFQVGPLVANSFSIAGSMRLFKEVLHAPLESDRRTRAVKAKRSDGSASVELPVRGLPPEVAKVIETITFTPPPDFGPTNY